MSLVVNVGLMTGVVLEWWQTIRAQNILRKSSGSESKAVVKSEAQILRTSSLVKTECNSGFGAPAITSKLSITEALT